MRIIFALMFLGALAGASCVDAADLFSLEPGGYITDAAGVLPTGEVGALNTLLAQLNEQYSVIVMGVSVPSLEGNSIDTLAKYFYDQWDIGRTTSNQSALILMSKDDGQIHVYTGMGLRGVLSSQWAQKLSARLDPLVEKKEYNRAMVAVLTSVVQRVHARSEDMPTQKASRFGVASTGVESSGGNFIQRASNANLPIAAIIAAGFGGLLLITTLVRAQSQGGAYEWGRDFERGRTGAFGNKNLNGNPGSGRRRLTDFNK